MNKQSIYIVDKALPKNEEFYDDLMIETKKLGLNVSYGKELEEAPVDAVLLLAAPMNVQEMDHERIVLGLRTINRRERLEIAEKVVSSELMALWASPESEAELARVLNSWGKDSYIFKYDWSAGRRGVRFLRHGTDALPEDYASERDVIMEHLDDDTYTYKADLCCGVLLNGWCLKTLGIASGDFYAHTKRPTQYEIPQDVRFQLEALSTELMRYGSGYISVDMMMYHGQLKIIEINTNSVGRNISWNNFGANYLKTYPKGLENLAAGIPHLPDLGELRQIQAQQNKLLPPVNP